MSYLHGENDRTYAKYSKERIVDLFKTYEEAEFDKDGKFIPKKIMRAPVQTGMGEDGNELDIDMQVVED